MLIDDKTPIYPVIPVLINGKTQIITLRPQQIQPPVDAPAAQPLAWATKKTTSLAKVLIDHNYEDRHSMKICGLVNNNNMCYLNSVLQALIHCPQFLAVLVDIKTNIRLQIGHDTPVLDALVTFTNQYEVQAGFGAHCSSAEHFYRIITEHPNFRHLQRGRQEDAQEFLGYLLETLEQTFDKVLAHEPRPSQEERSEGQEETDSWTQVGKHNKRIVERKAGIESASTNPIVKLFGGKIRNVFRQRDQNPSISVDPFQQVLLEISPTDVVSAEDAIKHMTSPEEITIEKNAKQIVATKQLEFVRAPPILIMSFKRFTFFLRNGEYDFGKITKPINLDEVKIDINGSKVRYRPRAIVYHHGSSATAGHYTTEVYKDGLWYGIDDDYVAAQKDKSSGRAAYMAFYEQVN